MDPAEAAQAQALRASTPDADAEAETLLEDLRELTTEAADLAARAKENAERRHRILRVLYDADRIGLTDGGEVGGMSPMGLRKMLERHQVELRPAGLHRTRRRAADSDTGEG